MLAGLSFLFIGRSTSVRMMLKINSARLLLEICSNLTKKTNEQCLSHHSGILLFTWNKLLIVFFCLYEENFCTLKKFTLTSQYRRLHSMASTWSWISSGFCRLENASSNFDICISVKCLGQVSSTRTAETYIFSVLLKFVDEEACGESLLADWWPSSVFRLFYLKYQLTIKRQVPPISAKRNFESLIQLLRCSFDWI